MTKAARIAELATRIDLHHWWRFPEEEQVRGFLLTDPLFIVGDQPSTSAWPPSNPNRRAFYDLLSRIGVPNTHLTDLYKTRGRSSALKAGVPPDLAEHVTFFREELGALSPTHIVALGNLAFDLIATHIPEVKPLLRKMWHFAYAQQSGRILQWEESAREAIWGETPLPYMPRRRQPPFGTAAANNLLTQEGTSQAGSHSEITGIHRQYEFSRLGFRADVIEPLSMDDRFCIVTPVGTFAMTKRQFYEAFPNVVASKSYRYGKIYYYPTVPQKALLFKIGS